MPAPLDTPIPPFDRHFFDSSSTFTRIGSGSLGGKAAGLVMVRERILAELPRGEFAGFEVVVPTLTVLATDVFREFMEQNDLYPLALSDEPDDRIAHAFQRADLPPRYLGDLRALITQVRTPLAIRSSSLLEDALDHPFAGVYATKMIPNNQPEIDTRFRKLTEAIKFVFASAFFRAARSYIWTIGQDIRAERMAVIIQEVVGIRHGDRFYPTLSGVARSYNYYPAGGSDPRDGVVSLALGLGKTIVDGSICWSYSPVRPKAPPPFKGMADMLKGTQTGFWAVHMGRPPLPDPIHETEYLVKAGISEAEFDGTLSYTASTYDPQSDRLFAGTTRPGPRVLTFAPILVANRIPLNALLRLLLSLSREALGADVEIEFALDLDPKSGLPARLGFLQVRPMMVSAETLALEPEELCGPQVLLASESVLGNGSRHGIRNLVYVKPESFDTRHTLQIVAELETINRTLVARGDPYLLIGFGRWGSTDAWMGIPVEWGQICGAKVIVEATLPEISPDLSQGSHFFHNLIAFQVLYFSVPHQGRHPIDWDWLRLQPTVSEGPFVRHVRTEAHLDIRADGRRQRGVVKHT